MKTGNSPWRFAPLIGLVILAGALLNCGGLISWIAPFCILVLMPVVEHPLPGTAANVTDEATVRADARYDAVLYTLAAHQNLILFWLFQQLGDPRVGGLGRWGAVATAGLFMGAVGLNVAHELGHRPGWLPRLTALTLLGHLQYGHFRVEHNRGHHARVGTPEDAATARRGESIYRFWVRSAVLGWWSAWGLEATRLRAQGRRVLSPRNEVLVLQVIQVAALGVIGFGLGPGALGGYLVAVLIGVLLTESVNYIQHYGLARALRPDGRRAPAHPGLSWNSNRPITRVLLLELSRHADHHRYPRRPYSLLRDVPGTPTLPSGYMGLILLALLPPLWFAVMHPRLDAVTDQPLT